MIDISPQIKDDELDRFPSLASLKAANNDLLKQRREAGNTKEFLIKVEAFLMQGQATGATLNADDDRWAAQTILDYWTNFLLRAGAEPLDVALADFDPALAPELGDAQCPYLGLGAFPESKHDLFFGREKLVEKAVCFLNEGNRLLAVVGPSGSGKSSLVLAGLLPALKTGTSSDSQNWHYYEPIVPGSDPLSSLAGLTGTSALTGAEQAQQIKSFQDDHNRLLQLIKSKHAEPALIVIDQFEEIFTLCLDNVVRRAFINNLIKLVQSPGAGHTVIVTIRSDFEVYVAKLPELQMLFNRATIRVTPLSASELREAIEKPAERVGLRFEDGIVNQLISEVLGEPAGLPLLQFTLLKLWKRRVHNLITWEAFRELGSCREALTRSADKLYNSLIPQSQKTLERILLRLVRPGEGLEVFSNRVRRDALDQMGEPPERVERVLNMLIEEGLLRKTGGDAASDVQIEVAHEALIRNWTKLMGWLEDERVNLRRRLRLTDAARAWEAAGRDSDALLRGSQLDEAMRYDDLSGLEKLFVQKSQTRQKRGRVILISCFVVASLSLALLSMYSILQSRYALNAERTASSRQLAAQALSPLNKRLDRALLLSLEAINVEATTEARSSLLSNLQQSPYLTAFLHGLEAESVVTAFDAESNTLTSASKDGVINTWNVTTHQIVQSAVVDKLDNNDRVMKGAFSPDLKSLALGSTRGKIIVWDVAAGRKKYPEFELSKSFVTSLAFSRDSKILVASCNGPTTIVLFDVETGRELQKLPGHSGATQSLAFSPDGKVLASGGTNGDVILWDLTRYRMLRALVAEYEGLERSVDSLAFSENGKVLASAGSSGISLWNLSNYKTVYKHEGETLSLTFSSVTKQQTSESDGKTLVSERTTLASGSEDGSIILWDLSWDSEKSLTVCKLERLAGHSGPVSVLAFSPDSKRLASGGSDKAVILWDIKINTDDATLFYICDRRRRGIWDVSIIQRLGTPLKVNKDNLLTVAYSSDGRFLAAETEKSSILLWNACTLEVIEISGVSRTSARVGSIAFSPNGKILAATNGSENVFLFDLDSKQKINQLNGHSNQVNSVAFSPDGKILASGSADKTVILWDVVEWKILHKLEGHSQVINSVAFSPDGNILASASTDFTVTLWDMRNAARNSPLGKLEISRPEALSGERGAGAIAFSPDGKILASDGWGNAINLWDVASLKLLGQPLRDASDMLGEEPSSIKCLAFSPDNSVLASGSTDASIILWDIATRQEIGRFLVPAGEPVSLAFQPNGAQLASSYKNKNTIYLWDVSLESWKKSACVIANRKLGRWERQRIMGNKDYKPACDSYPSLEDQPQK